MPLLAHHRRKLSDFVNSPASSMRILSTLTLVNRRNSSMSASGDWRRRDDDAHMKSTPSTTITRKSSSDSRERPFVSGANRTRRCSRWAAHTFAAPSVATAVGTSDSVSGHTQGIGTCELQRGKRDRGGSAPGEYTQCGHTLCVPGGTTPRATFSNLVQSTDMLETWVSDRYHRPQAGETDSEKEVAGEQLQRSAQPAASDRGQTTVRGLPHPGCWGRVCRYAQVPQCW
mmetsp:Transcript_17711/g.35541  ORF Transcript_17711/g.35541 Transcript_17711/m.35541 type:complete len:229 (+) Transcript_17711:363-1049(+)